MRRVLLPILLALLVWPAAGHAAISDEIIVKRVPGLSSGERAEVRADADVRLQRTLPLDRVELVRTAPGERAEALRALNADPDVQYAEPNVVVEAAGRGQDEPWFASLWGLKQYSDVDTDADEAWGESMGEGVVVGIVDSGVDLAHPDLAGQAVGGRNFVADGVAADNPRDGYGHGTHVAGTVAAAVNGGGVTGVAPGAKVMPLRVLGDLGSGSMADVAAAFAYAGDHGVRVVNASLRSLSAAQVERDAIAAHPNTLYVVAAGNDTSHLDGGGSAYPCKYPEANLLCVGAITSAGAQASFSNWGAVSVDLHAPGASILSSYLNQGWATMSGTSMASPHAAGAAALVAAQHPDWTGEQIKARLMDTVDVSGQLTGRSRTGGRLNAARAVGAAIDPDGHAPAIPQTLTVRGVAAAHELDWDDVADSDLVAYQVWKVDPVSWTWTPLVRTTASHVRIESAPDVYATFRVSAMDLDEDGTPSTQAGAWTLAPGRAPAPVATPAPAATPWPEPGSPAQSAPADDSPATADPTPSPTTSRSPSPFPSPTLTPSVVRAPVSIAGLNVTGAPAMNRTATVHFTLSAPARVALTLRRQAGERWRGAGSRTVPLAGGAQRLTLKRRTLLGLRLAPGVYELRARAGASAASARFRVR